MTRITARLALVSLAALLGACSSSSAGASASAAPIAASSLTASTTTATPAATPPATPTASPSTGGGGPQPTPGSIDPCTLLTSAEASQLIGTKLPAGISEVVAPARVCTFRAGTREVRLFLWPPAPDVDTAKAYYDAARAEALSKLPTEFPGVQIHQADLTLFDRSAYVSGSGSIGSVSAIYVVDGKQAFEIFCALAACSQNALQGGATLVAGRLP